MPVVECLGWQVWERSTVVVDQRSVVTAPVIWWPASTSGIAGHRSNAPQGWLTPNDHTSPKPTCSPLGTWRKAC